MKLNVSTIFIVQLIVFAGVCAGCTTNSDCGCGGECDTSHPDSIEWECSTFGDVCGGSEPFCIPEERRCVECTRKTQCSRNYQCIQNECKECSIDRDCASNTNCDAECKQYSCQINSDLNCRDTNQHCLVGSAVCVDCVSDVDCPSNKPFCDRLNRTCRGCENDEQCNSDNICGAFCNPTNKLCVTPENVTNCHDNLFLKKCDAKTGNCHQCITHADCRNRGSCNAKCVEVSAQVHPHPVFVCQDVSNRTICCDGTECDKQTGECIDVSSSGGSVGSILVTSFGVLAILILII